MRLFLTPAKGILWSGLFIAQSEHPPASKDRHEGLSSGQGSHGQWAQSPSRGTLGTPMAPQLVLP